jgi:hypothetical protein
MIVVTIAFAIASGGCYLLLAAARAMDDAHYNWDDEEEHDVD